MDLTRNEIGTQIKLITQTTKNPDAVKSALQSWLVEQNCGDFEQKQILNDLNSYPEYLELVN
jgi:hypothetical protein